MKSPLPKILAFLLTLLVSHPIFSQDHRPEERVIRDRPDYRRGVNIYAIIPSFTTSPYANINANLIQNGYPLLPRGHLNYGFGFMYRHNRILIGMDLFWGNQVVTIDEPSRAMLKRNPWTYSLNLGYHVFKRDYLAIYPQVGFSYTDTNLFLSKSGQASSLDDILQNPGNSVNLYHESAGVFLGVGFDFHWLFTKESPLVSLKVGKRIQVEDSYEWSSFYNPISNAPGDNFNYWMIQLGMGGVFNWDKKSNR